MVFGIILFLEAAQKSVLDNYERKRNNCENEQLRQSYTGPFLNCSVSSAHVTLVNNNCGNVPDSAMSFSSIENAFDEAPLLLLLALVIPVPWPMLAALGVCDGDDTCRTCISS